MHPQTGLVAPAPPRSSGSTHPNDRGHQVIAELLASLLLKAAAEEREGWEAAVAEAAGWAPERQWGQPGAKGPRLPPPMIPGNADIPTSLCAIQVGVCTRLGAGEVQQRTCLRGTAILVGMPLPPLGQCVSLS